mmetsp:Transcript_15229/g.33134  ORF Transcript_15229/g.33134 Transcript_15229/m.33134 type:complete len:251 (+) Transcript_15229:288-1040(+)
MVLSSAEAKKEYFLSADDLSEVPRETLYGGFGTGRAMYIFNEDDLEAAALAKHGEMGLAKKRAARQKREENKRKRAVAAAETEAAMLAANPALEAKKQRLEIKAAKVRERNLRIVGKPWELTITAPQRVAGTKAELVIGNMPPTGWPGESSIDCDKGPAYSYGNIHGFKGKSSEDDTEMVFETKWKVLGKRHTGKLSVQVKPNDKTDGDPKEQSSSANKQEEEPLMIVGKFDSGVNDGVRRWSFKGYRKQ